jgi:TP901 family phage tail tape measure protein
MVDLKITIQAKDDSSGTVDSVERSFESLFSGIKSDLHGLTEAFEDSADQIVDEFKKVGDKIESAVKSRGGGSLPGLGPLGNMIGGGLLKLPGFVFGALSKVAGIVGQVLFKVPGIILGIFTGAFKAVLSVAKSILSGLGSVIGFALKGIGGILDTFLLAPFRLVFNKITALAASVGVGAGLKFAADFQDSMTVAFALIPGEITPALRQSMQRTLEDIRASTSAGGKELGRALFTAISTGFAEAAPVIVGAAAKLAAVGETADDVTSTTQALVGVLRAYNLEAKDAQKIADQLQMTQKLGNITNAEVAQQLGRVISAAKGAGIALEDLLATISLSTVKGMTAEQAFTGLGGAIVALSAPSPEAVKRLKAMNVELHDSQGQFIGLYAAIQKLAALNLDVQSLRQVIPEKMARNFFIAISGSLAKYKEFIGEIREATGVLDEAMEERNRAISRQFLRMGGNIANIFSTILGFVEEDVAGAAEKVADVIGNVTDRLRGLKDEGKIDELKTAIGETFDKVGEWIPSLDEIKRGFEKVTAVGIQAWNLIGREFDVFRKAWGDFVEGNEADLSDSLLVTGARIAFIHIQNAAAKSINWIKDQFSNIFTSDTGKALGEKAAAVFKVIEAQFSASLLRMEIEAEYYASKIASLGLGIGYTEHGVDERGHRFTRERRLEFGVSKEAVDRLRDQVQAPVDNAINSMKRVFQEGIPLGGIKIESGDLDELERRFKDIISSGAGKDSAKALTDQIFQPIESIAEEVKKLVAGPDTDVQPIIDNTLAIKQSIAGAKFKIATTKEAIVDFTMEQRAYIDAQGELNKDIVERVRQLQTELQAEKQFIKMLQEALGAK